MLPFSIFLLELYSRCPQIVQELSSTMLKGCENATLASLEIDSFLKPWVRDGLASMPNLLTRREIEVGSALVTLEKMPSSEAFDLVSIDASKRGHMCYVRVLIAWAYQPKTR